MAWEGEVVPPAAEQGDTERFEIQLSEDKETVVNFKKLRNRAGAAQQAPAPPLAEVEPLEKASPAEGRADGSVSQVNDLEEPKDLLPPPKSRFDSVIAKIEGLYTQNQGSDEERPSQRQGSDASDNSYYDTDDSFIDDAELNEYFENRGRPQLAGFYVNRGELAVDKESLPPPKRRKLKNRKKLHKEGKDDEDKGKPGLKEDKVRKKLKRDKKVKSAEIEKTAGKDPALNMGLLGAPDGRARLEWPSRAETSKATPSAPPSHPQPDAGQPPKPGNEQALRQGQLNEAPPRPCVLQSDSHKDAVSGDKKTVMTEDKKASEDKHVGSATPGTPHSLAGEPGGIDMQSPEGVLQKKKEVTVKRRAVPQMKIGKRLEQAILELEKAVSEKCPRNERRASAEGLSQEPNGDSQGGSKRFRMPKHVFEKLRKVARLSTKEGVVHEAVFNRLKGFLNCNHQTLRQNLKKLAVQPKPLTALEDPLPATTSADVNNDQILGIPESMDQARLGSAADAGPSGKPPWLTGASKAPRGVDTSGGEEPAPSGQAKEVLQKLRAKLADQKRQAGPSGGAASEVAGDGKAVVLLDKETEELVCCYADLRTEGMAIKAGRRARAALEELEQLWPGGEVNKEQLQDTVRRVRSRQQAKKKRQEKKEEATGAHEGSEVPVCDLADSKLPARSHPGKGQPGAEPSGLEGGHARLQPSTNGVRQGTPVRASLDPSEAPEAGPSKQEDAKAGRDEKARAKEAVQNKPPAQGKKKVPKKNNPKKKPLLMIKSSKKRKRPSVFKLAEKATEIKREGPPGALYEQASAAPAEGHPRADVAPKLELATLEARSAVLPNKVVIEEKMLLQHVTPEGVC